MTKQSKSDEKAPGWPSTQQSDSQCNPFRFLLITKYNSVCFHQNNFEMLILGRKRPYNGLYVTTLYNHCPINFAFLFQKLI